MNTALALQLLGGVLHAASTIQQLIAAASEQRRDLTEAELDQIRNDLAAADDRWLAQLRAARARDDAPSTETDQ